MIEITYAMLKSSNQYEVLQIFNNLCYQLLDQSIYNLLSDTPYFIYVLKGSSKSTIERRRC